MKLTKRDIQYIMNEARNIVAEKRGVVNENAVDAVKVATRAEAGADMENGKHLVNTAKKFAGKVAGAAKKAAQMVNGAGKQQDKGQRPGQPQTAGNAMRKGAKVPTTSKE